MKNKKMCLSTKIGIITASICILISVFRLFTILPAAHRNVENLATFEETLEQLDTWGEIYLTYKLRGYTKDEIRSVWGNPDNCYSYGTRCDMWDIVEHESTLIVYYSDDNVVQKISYLEYKYSKNK